MIRFDFLKLIIPHWVLALLCLLSLLFLLSVLFSVVCVVFIVLCSWCQRLLSVALKALVGGAKGNTP